MKILQLCKKFPYPLRDGEAIAVNHLGRGLSELGCEMTLLSMNTQKHYFDVKKLPETFDHYKQIETTFVDNSLKITEAFANLFSKDSYHISRFVSKPFADELRSILSKNSFDVVQLETLYLAPYISIIRKYSNAMIVLRAHNVEHEIWSRVSRNTENGIKRRYLNYLTEKLERYEKSVIKSCDLLVPITDRDLASFRAMGYDRRAQVIPIGLNVSDYRADYQSFTRSHSIGYIGSLDWTPNLEGLKWFLEEIWPSAKEIYPTIKMEIAGRNPPKLLEQYGTDQITVVGEVDDAQTFINRHSLVAVPLLSGSGMRAKILEAMAMGKVVITTTLGLEGIEARHKEHVLIADSKEEFVEALNYCMRANGGLTQLAKNARKLVEERYDGISTSRILLKKYQKALEQFPQKAISSV